MSAGTLPSLSSILGFSPKQLPSDFENAFVQGTGSLLRLALGSKEFETGQRRITMMADLAFALLAMSSVSTRRWTNPIYREMHRGKKA